MNKEFEEMAEQLLGIETESVGKVDDITRMRFNILQEKKDEFRKVVKAELEALKEKHEKMATIIEEEHNNLWDGIYDMLSIDPDGNYTVNSKTGEVIQKHIPEEVQDLMDIADIMED